MGVIQSQNASEINEINEVLPTIRTTKIARHITIIWLWVPWCGIACGT